MGPATAIKTGFAKSFDFKGRASRSEFWWFVVGLLILATHLPTKANALSDDQLAELSDLCSRPHQSLQHIDNSFVDAGWVPFSEGGKAQFITDLAILKILEDARSQYTLAALNSLADPAAALDPNAPDPEVVRWAMRDVTRFREAYSSLDREPALHYQSSTMPRIGVRISFLGDTDSPWHQHCDTMAKDADQAMRSLRNLFHNSQIGETATYGILQRSRFELPSQSLNQFAATPKATANIFNMSSIVAGLGGVGVMPFWLNISLSIKQPTDLTPLEVNP